VELQGAPFVKSGGRDGLRRLGRRKIGDLLLKGGVEAAGGGSGGGGSGKGRFNGAPRLDNPGATSIGRKRRPAHAGLEP